MYTTLQLINFTCVCNRLLTTNWIYNICQFFYYQGYKDLFIYLLTSAVNRNINIYKQEDGSGTLTQREPITLVTCYKTNKYTQNFTTYNFKYQTRI